MNYKTKLHHLTTFAFDVDGVLTDGSVMLVPDAEPVRTFNVKDAFALQKAVKAGYRVAIITGGSSEAVKERLLGLGVQAVRLRASDEADTMDELMHRYGLKASEIMYMGDDLPDLAPMAMAGLSACPHDAATEVRQEADYISPKAGGKGCARDIIEQTLRLHGKWNQPELRNW